MSVHRDKGDVARVAAVLQATPDSRIQCRLVGPHCTLLQLPLAAWGRHFQNFNLGVVNMLDDLDEIAHIEPLRAGRALHEVIGLIFGEAICVDPRLVIDSARRPAAPQ
jgi:hypothetical protein